MELRGREKVEYDAWLAEKASIKRATPASRESAEARKKRIAKLTKTGNEAEFGHYYFSHLVDSDFAYFHKKDMKAVAADPDIMAALEYPREHAKSTVFGVIMPMLLIAKGEFTGMVCGSANEKKASKLLADIQSELMFNQRFIADFGEQYNAGKWTEGYFCTKQGFGFWAFGRGQSPRGIKESAFRPNYGLIDDIDDKQIVKNTDRVEEAVDWMVEDFYGCLPIKGARFVIIGNRIFKTSILATFIGDIEPDDPKRGGLYHSKVFALENPKTHAKDLSENGVPAWPRYTREQIINKMTKMGWRNGLREYFHEHIIEGKIFKDKNLPWIDCLPLAKYEALLTYNDPSYKATMTSDCKAIGLIGKIGRFYDVIDIFDEQCTTPAMVKAHYKIADQIPEEIGVRHYMEANFIQDLMLEEYFRHGEKVGHQLRIRGDKRKKPEKEIRIENLTSFTDMGYIRFNKQLKSNPHMQTLRNQFLGFPDKQMHDDGPDMVEGAVWLLEHKYGDRKPSGRHTGELRQGKSNASNSRSY